MAKTRDPIVAAMTDAELFRDFSADFRALRERPDLRIELRATAAWVVMAQLQLALRHPDNVGEGAAIARRFAHELQRAVANTPALRIVAEQGWEPEEDGATLWPARQAVDSKQHNWH